MTSPDLPEDAPVSPDLVPYVDLTLDDRDPQDLVDLALADFTAKTGEDATWPEGSAEALLVEALALEDAEVIYAINRLPATIFLIVMRALFHIERDEGAPAFGPVEVTAVDNAGHLVPAGTQFSAPLAGGEVVVFTVDADIAIPAGLLAGAGTATADTSGVAGNGFAVDAELALLSPLSFVDHVAFTAASAGGRDRELDAAFLTRVAQLGRTLTIVLANPAQFARYALAQPGVFRAMAINAYDPAVGPVGANGGHVTVAVLDAAGAVLSAPAKAALEALLEARASADLAVHIIDPTITDVTVTATVHVAAGYDPVVVGDAVRAALADYLSPLTWLWGAVVRRNDLIALMEDVEGVDFVTAGHPTAPAADLALAGAAPLARFNAGASVITAVQP